MGFFFTLLYIITAYLSPEFLLGDLRQYHIGIILAFLAVLASLPSLSGSRLFRTPQTYLIVGLSAAVVLSLIANGWFGGAVQAIEAFLPQGFGFFLILINCRSLKRIKILVTVLYSIAAFTIIMAMHALASGNWGSPFLLSQQADNLQYFYRIRGLASINDPNDFSQLLVSLLPLLWINWIPSRPLRNTALVLAPAAFLIFGMYQTHSRGAAIALVAIIFVGLRHKLGTIRCLLLAGMALAAGLALNWSGGREISMEAGSGRMDAWGVGLQLLKSHPLFGVGFNRFTEFNWITAHNTIVVCAAELGLFGFYFWTNAVVFTILDLLRIRSISPEDRRAGECLDLESDQLPGQRQQTAEQIKHWANLLFISLVGFLTAGWFLSRAYVLTLFVYMGMAQALYQLSIKEGIIDNNHPLSRPLRYGAVTVLGALVVVYAMLRLRPFM